METKQYTKLGLSTAFISFLLGTIIFILYFLTSALVFLFVGYAFIALIGIINIAILISILLKAIKDHLNRKKLLTTSAIMLLNIPIMVFYCWIAIILLGALRITLKNETGTDLTEINIIGCGGGYIAKLQKGVSKTIWVPITGDCSIYMNYLSLGRRKRERVVGYTTSGDGKKLSYKIDGKDKEI